MKKWFYQNWIWPLMMAATYLFGSWMVNFDHHKKYIWADAEGYYMYLPAVVMYGGDFSKIPVRTKVHFEPYPGTDKIFTKYNYGIAVLEAPFFIEGICLPHGSRFRTKRLCRHGLFRGHFTGRLCVWNLGLVFYLEIVASTFHRSLGGQIDHRHTLVGHQFIALYGMGARHVSCLFFFFSGLAFLPYAGAFICSNFQKIHLGRLGGWAHRPHPTNEHHTPAFPNALWNPLMG